MSRSPTSRAKTERERKPGEMEKLTLESLFDYLELNLVCCRRGRRRSGSWELEAQEPQLQRLEQHSRALECVSNYEKLPAAQLNDS